MAKRSKKGPEFVKWFTPLLDALRAKGGSGRPREVVDWIAQACNVSEEEQNRQSEKGVPQFYNQVAWARLYLVKGGFLDESSPRGVWVLTDKGQKTKLRHTQALAVFSDVQRQMSKGRGADQTQADTIVEAASDAEDESPPDIEESHRGRVLQVLKEMPPFGFERFCQRLLRESGFEEVVVTKKSKDGGIDGFGVLRLNSFVALPVCFQCKRYSGTVGSEDIQKFRGAMATRAEKGLFLTTGTFTKGAKAEAIQDKTHPIELIDGEKLVDQLEQLALGLRPVTAFEVDEGFFAQFCE